MNLENIWAYGLLEDVKKDAIRKADGKKLEIWIYEVLQKMMELYHLVRKEGLLTLEEAVQDIQLDHECFAFLLAGTEYIVNGCEFDLVAEALTTEYWVKNPRGMEALASYICIRGIVEIISNNGFSPYMLEMLLKSVLTEECRAEYQRYKENVGAVPKLDKPRESLEKIYLELNTKGKILRDKLEKMLVQVSDSTIKEAVWKLKDKQSTDLALVIKGLSNIGREKLFSCMPGTLADRICEESVYMGPVRIVDMEDAFVCLIDCIDDISKKRIG